MCAEYGLHMGILAKLYGHCGSAVDSWKFLGGMHYGTALV